MGSLNCNELKMKKYTLLLIWVYLALASCGSPKNLGPSFGGGDEMPELVSKVESKERTIAEASEGSSIVIETKGDVKSSTASEIVERPIHRISYQKNVLVQPTHHRQSLLLDSQAIDSNQFAFKKWTRVTNLGKLVFLVGLLSIPFVKYPTYLIAVLGLFLMVYGSKKRHKYKPIAESQNTGPTPNLNAVLESPELRELKRKKDQLSALLMTPIFAFPFLLMLEMSVGMGVGLVVISLILSFVFLIAYLQASMAYNRKRKALLEEAN